MIKVNFDGMELDGSFPLIATEASLLLKRLREEDDEFIPQILSCVYTDGGAKNLADTIEGYKKDTEQTLKLIEAIIKRKKEKGND